MVWICLNMDPHYLGLTKGPKDKGVVRGWRGMAWDCRFLGFRAKKQIMDKDFEPGAGRHDTQHIAGFHLRQVDGGAFVPTSAPAQDFGRTLQHRISWPMVKHPKIDEIRCQKDVKKGRSFYELMKVRSRWLLPSQLFGRATHVVGELHIVHPQLTSAFALENA